MHISFFFLIRSAIFVMVTFLLCGLQSQHKFNKMYSYTVTMARLKIAHGALIKVMPSFETVNVNILNILQMLTIMDFQISYVTENLFTQGTFKIYNIFISFLMSFNFIMFCVNKLVHSDLVFPLKVALIALVLMMFSACSLKKSLLGLNLLQWDHRF